jgi:hypothetical protein
MKIHIVWIYLLAYCLPVFAVECGNTDDHSVKSKFETLHCINCKSAYAYEEDIIFNIAYRGDENLCFHIGIKVFRNGEWILLGDSITPWYGEEEPPLTRTEPNSIIRRIWASKQKYGLEKGAKLMLFAWQKSALPQGIHKNIHEFTLLSKVQ